MSGTEVWVDYYRVLSISEDASADEIKRAYRRMARRHHPDMDPSPGAADRFLLIQAAFDVLNDVEQRTEYDADRRIRLQRAEVQSGALAMRWALSQRTLECRQEPQIVYALLDIVVTATEYEGGLPLNLCLLLDCSSSMRGASLLRLKEAARFVVDQLTEEDGFSLIAFNDRAQVLIPSRGSVHHGVIRAAINALESRGGTEIAQGLSAALQEVRHRASPKYLSHIVFLTDGHTYGDEDACLDLARQAGAASIGISALGLGPYWNEALLDSIATRSGGFSMYIDSPEGITPAFQEQILRLRDVIVRNASLEIDLGMGVKMRGTYRFFPVIASLDVTAKDHLSLPLGSVERHAGQTLLVELQTPPLSAPGPVALAHFQLMGELLTKQSKKRDILVQMDLVTNCAVDPERSPLDPRLRGFVERIVAYRLQERAWQDLAEDHIEQATSRLRSVATKLLELGEVDLARETIRESKRLEVTGQTSLIGKKRIRYGTRNLGSLLPWRSPSGKGSGS